MKIGLPSKPSFLITMTSHRHLSSSRGRRGKDGMRSRRRVAQALHDHAGRRRRRINGQLLQTVCSVRRAAQMNDIVQVT